jgi:hypothetical protein
MGRIALVLGVISACLLGASHAPSTQSSNTLLPDDSHWTGTLRRDPRVHRSKDSACHAHITSRDGEKFTARVSLAGVSVKLEGTIDKDGKIKATVTDVVSGEAAIVGKEWTGQANDTEWLLEWTAKNGADRRAELKLDTSKHGRKRDKSDDQ